MSTSPAKPLIEELQLLPTLDTPTSRSIIPVNIHSLFLDLAEQAIQLATETLEGEMLVIVDAHTAMHAEQFETLAQRAKHVIFMGKPTAALLAMSHVHSRNWNDIPNVEEHVLVLLSKTVSLGLIGMSKSWTPGETPSFVGGWTFDHEHVMSIAKAVAGDAARQWESSRRETLDAESLQNRMATAMMRRQATLLTSLQRDMAMDKNDLFSVLNILKAISAKRRAHDVLFVFVEQIARVVNAERCSVVRIWGSDKLGQVLASHEDSSVNHHEIDLRKYPELRAALHTHEKIIIQDIGKNALTREIGNVLSDAGIQSLLVIPIVLFDETIGSLFLRAARSSGPFKEREISFFEVVAEAAANALERAHLFESIQIANERLERLAITDGLTGLYNHRYCRDRLEDEFQRAARYRLPLSCLIFDVDNFKACNDNYGHLLGDTILREIAARTLMCIRKSDVVARYGGEEFIVIMPQTEAAGAIAEGERLRRSVADRQFKDLPDGAQVTVSVGVASFDHDKMLNYDDIIRAADIALYQAKRSGKNRVVAFEGAIEPVRQSPGAPKVQDAPKEDAT